MDQLLRPLETEVAPASGQGDEPGIRALMAMAAGTRMRVCCITIISHRPHHRQLTLKPRHLLWGRIPFARRASSPPPWSYSIRSWQYHRGRINKLARPYPKIPSSIERDTSLPQWDEGQDHGPTEVITLGAKDAHSVTGSLHSGSPPWRIPAPFHLTATAQVPHATLATSARFLVWR